MFAAASWIDKMATRNSDVNNAAVALKLLIRHIYIEGRNREVTKDFVPLSTVLFSVCINETKKKRKKINTMEIKKSYNPGVSYLDENCRISIFTVDLALASLVAPQI